ncbi:MAG: RNA 3'-terminal phosphate cyclase [Nanoarchaeota archaeon]
MIELDGSLGEGGGAILRTALALSTVTAQGFRLSKIRAGRPNPGLAAQHLTCIQTYLDMCGSVCEGNTLGSTSITYYPRALRKHRLSIDIGTAGSITLLCQAILPALLSSARNSRIEIIGGTDVKWSPQSDYFSNVVCPMLKAYGDVTYTIQRRGYYPKGGGNATMTIKPTPARPTRLLRRGAILAIRGIAHSNSNETSERMAAIARLHLRQHGAPVLIDATTASASCPGGGITVWAICEGEDGQVILGSDALLEGRAEACAEEAVRKLGEELNSGACVDRHLADMLIPLLCLHGGAMTCSAISSHTTTNITIATAFTSATPTIEGNTITYAPRTDK